MENAVCCEDHLHCCPEGYTCDVKDGRCNKGDVSQPFLQKIKAIIRQDVQNEVELKEGVVCPGGSSQCEAGNN
jgi:hypothetical protein